MAFQSRHLDPLTNVSVAISGNWLAVPQHCWQGIATAPEPIAAVVFLNDGTVVTWCKSDKRSSEQVPIQLTLFPSAPTSGSMQVHFSTGDGSVRWTTPCTSTPYRSIIPEDRIIQTGEIVLFACIDGTPAIELHLLLIVRRDLKGGRKGLWQVRAALQRMVPEPVATMLSSGRTGTRQLPEQS